MSNIKNWLKIITNNDLHAYNKVSTRDLALCFNFLQIPDTSTVVMTVTVMKNKIKKNALEPVSFAKVMSCIEDSLSDTMWKLQNTSIKDVDLPEYFVGIKSQLTSEWYVKLCCHRVFFIPEEALFEVLGGLFNQDKIRVIKSNFISEVSVFVNTDNYDFNAKFY